MAAGIAVALALHLKMVLLLHLCCIHQQERVAGNVHLQGGGNHFFTSDFCSSSAGATSALAASLSFLLRVHFITIIATLVRCIELLHTSALLLLPFPFPSACSYPLRPLLCAVCASGLRLARQIYVAVAIVCFLIARHMQPPACCMLHTFRRHPHD